MRSLPKCGDTRRAMESGGMVRVKLPSLLLLAEEAKEQQEWKE